MEVYTRIWKWFFFSAYTICRVFLFILFIRENSQKTWLFELSVFIFKSPSFLSSSVVCWHLIRRLGPVSLCCSSSSLWWCLTTRWMGCVYAFRSLNLHYIYRRSVLSLCVHAIKMAKREKVESWKWDFLRTRSLQQNDSFCFPPLHIRFLTIYICVCTLAFSFSELYTHCDLHTHTIRMVLGVTVCVQKRVVYQESGKELEMFCNVSCIANSQRQSGRTRKEENNLQSNRPTHSIQQLENETRKQ
jgi:hypothetical protein